MPRRQVLLAFVILFCGVGLARADDKDKKPKLELSREEQVVLDLTNKAREKENLEPLRPNALLFQAARAHSANMAKQRRMSHELDGKNFIDRADAVGYDYAQVGENVAMGQRLPAREVVKLWMGSPHHRDNILKDKYREIGIGIARNARGEVYYTQVFGTRR